MAEWGRQKITPISPDKNGQMSIRDLPRLNRARSTMSSGVTSALRQLIVDGTLAPDSRVAAEWVSKEMGVSRGPVREALRELESEGLVVVHPHRGAFVSHITPDELRYILIPIRVILEKEACLRSLPKLTDKNFAELRTITGEMRSASEHPVLDSLAMLVDLDVEYHRYLMELGGQHHAIQIWQSIQSRIRAGFYRLGLQHSDLLEIAQEHEALLDALLTKDPKVAVAAIESHICGTQLALLDLAEGRGPFGENGPSL